MGIISCSQNIISRRQMIHHVLESQGGNGKQFRDRLPPKKKTDAKRKAESRAPAQAKWALALKAYLHESRRPPCPVVAESRTRD